MKYVPFPDVVWFQEGPGVRNTQYTETGVKLLNVANLIDGKVDISNTNRYISEEEAYGKYKHFLVDKGDLIIASSGIKVEYFDKKMGFVDESQLPLCMNTSTIRFKALDKTVLDIRYFMYFLKSDCFKAQLGREITGSAQLNFGPSHLKKMKLPLIDIQEQQHIASVLDKVTDLIAQRRAQLDKLDLLVKSRFVEMFGDPVLNPMNWPSVSLDDMADIVSGITKGRKTKEYDLIEVPYMSVSNVKDGYIDWTTVKTIAATQSEIDQYRLLPNDVLMTEGGDPDKLGRGAIIKKPLENCIHQNHIFRVRLDETKIFPVYFAEYLQHQKAKQYFLRCAKQTTGIASINMTQLKKLPTLVPPIELQIQFDKEIEQINKVKIKIAQSLNRLEILKKSIMQEKFGG